MNGSPWTPAELETARRMRSEEGRSFQEIANTTGRSVRSVQHICALHHMLLPPAAKHQSALRAAAKRTALREQRRSP